MKKNEKFQFNIEICHPNPVFIDNSGTEHRRDFWLALSESSWKIAYKARPD